VTGEARAKNLTHDEASTLLKTSTLNVVVTMSSPTSTVTVPAHPPLLVLPAIRGLDQLRSVLRALRLHEPLLLDDRSMRAKTLVVIMIIEIAASFLLVFLGMFTTWYVVTGGALGELPD
jgi:hypothetical protein